MAEPGIQAMSVEEFFDWQLRQDRNYELVDGQPLLPMKMMTGATFRHDRVTTNVIGLLYNQLRGKPCRPATDDIALVIPRGNVRRPDILVECGSPDDKAMAAQDPRVVIEVLSPSTMGVDRFRKVEEYKTVAQIHVILLVDTEVPGVLAYRRRDGNWIQESYETLDGVIDLPEISARLALNELYEEVQFEGGGNRPGPIA